MDLVRGKPRRGQQDTFDDQKTGQPCEKRPNSGGIGLEGFGLQPVDFSSGGDIEGDARGSHTGHDQAKWYDNKRGQNGNGSPWDLLRKYAGKQENHDILEEECDPP